MNTLYKSRFSPAMRPALRRSLHHLLILALTMLMLSGCEKTPAETSRGDVSSEAASSTEEAVSTEAVPSTEAESSSETAPSSETESSSEATPSTEAEASTEVTSSTETEASTEVTSSTETEASSEAAPSSEATPSTNAEHSTESEPPSSLSIHDVAFVGDSRTLTMATGGRLEFGLIPDSSVFATWGGELHQDSAKANAANAGEADRKAAVFWYGINDVQSDPEQKLAPQFRANYEAIIDLYRNTNPDSEIVILSILSTSANEKDYYAGQEENIRTYNAELAALCAGNGYTYLDISALFTGDECLAPGDYIHFSKEWYEERFIPTVFGALGIAD